MVWVVGDGGLGAKRGWGVLLVVLRMRMRDEA